MTHETENLARYAPGDRLTADRLNVHIDATNMLVSRAAEERQLGSSEGEGAAGGSGEAIGDEVFVEDKAQRVTTVVEADVLDAPGGSPTGQVVAFERWDATVLVEQTSGREITLQFDNT